MKKLYLLLAGLLIASFAQARDIKFYLGDTEIAPNSTVYFNDVEKTPMGKMLQVTMEPKIFVSPSLATSAMTVTAECTSGQSIQLCAGGQCEKGTSVTKTGVKVGTNEKLNIMFDYSGRQLPTDPIPEVTAVITAEDHGVKVSFTIVMGENVGGVSDVESALSFKPAAGGIEYSLPGACRVSLYNLLGMKALETSIDGSGFLSTSSLPAGLYIYTLEGAAAKSGKIRVK